MKSFFQVFDMESFLGLFDPDTADDWVEKEDNAKGFSQLPPEPQLGNVEYKLKLVNPSKQRFEHLVTQVTDEFMIN